LQIQEWEAFEHAGSRVVSHRVEVLEVAKERGHGDARALRHLLRVGWKISLEHQVDEGVEGSHTPPIRRRRPLRASECALWRFEHG